jgi:hypothetical protein
MAGLCPGHFFSWAGKAAVAALHGAEPGREINQRSFPSNISMPCGRAPLAMTI